MSYLDPKDNRDNHSNQLNPNNDEYWNSRGSDTSSDDSDYDKLCDSDSNND